MYEIQTDVVIVGGGPAGLSAAVAAKKEGAEKVLIIERDYSGRERSDLCKLRIRNDKGKSRKHRSCDGMP